MSSHSGHSYSSVTSGSSGTDRRDRLSVGGPLTAKFRHGAGKTYGFLSSFINDGESAKLGSRSLLK